VTQDIHRDRLLILDFGSQYTQLIARRIREVGVYCEIVPWDTSDAEISGFKPSGIILSGGPESVTAPGSPRALNAYSRSTYPFSVFATVCRQWPSNWAAQ